MVTRSIRPKRANTRFEEERIRHHPTKGTCGWECEDCDGTNAALTNIITKLKEEAN
jgi:hypothetical protein